MNMKISPITVYMRKNAAKCLEPVRTFCQDVLITNRTFVNAKDEVVACLDTYHAKGKNGQYVIKSILSTMDGQQKFTSQDINCIRLDGKRHPYQISSVLNFNTSPDAQRKLFMIDGVTPKAIEKDGVKLGYTGSDGLLNYEKEQNFKTKIIKINSPVTNEDFTINI